jgi:hypothetical protein
MTIINRVVLAEEDGGMNWEIAMMKVIALRVTLKILKSKFPHDCEVYLRTGNDAISHSNTPTHYWIVVNGSADANPQLIKGIKDAIKVPL